MVIQAVRAVLPSNDVVVVDVVRPPVTFDKIIIIICAFHASGIWRRVVISDSYSSDSSDSSDQYNFVKIEPSLNYCVYLLSINAVYARSSDGDLCRINAKG